MWRDRVLRLAELSSRILRKHIQARVVLELRWDGFFPCIAKCNFLFKRKTMWHLTSRYLCSEHVVSHLLHYTCMLCSFRLSIGSLLVAKYAYVGFHHVSKSHLHHFYIAVTVIVTTTHWSSSSPQTS